MKKILHSICELLEAGETIVSATILRHAGSTPRTAGTKMIIRGNGKIIGTIGGGMVEAAVIQAALKVFQSGQAMIRTFDLNASNRVDSMDIICGGHLDVLIERIEPNSTTRRTFQSLLAALNSGQSGSLVSILPEEGDGPRHIEKFPISEGNALLGESFVPATILQTLKKQTGKDRNPILLTIENRRYLIEPAVGTGTVYIFGAGHVSLQLARLTQMVDFRTVVMDDRKDFANRERFDTADDIFVLTDFTQAFSGLEIDENSYVVIVTRGHRHDKTVLALALQTEAGYIGMIGSRRKRDAIYAALVQEGFTQNDLDRVHCPIGLKIGAETPQEIAVSIVAELVEARAKR